MGAYDHVRLCAFQFLFVRVSVCMCLMQVYVRSDACMPVNVRLNVRVLVACIDMCMYARVIKSWGRVYVGVHVYVHISCLRACANSERYGKRVTSLHTLA